MHNVFVEKCTDAETDLCIYAALDTRGSLINSFSYFSMKT